MAMSHANCIHPRTPAGRRACRADIITPTEQIVREETNGIGITPAAVRRQRMDGMQARLNSMATEPVKITGAVARRMARTAARADNMRIQPRRSGARVAVTSSTCVQAALHTGNSVCACGVRSGRYAEDVNAW